MQTSRPTMGSNSNVAQSGAATGPSSGVGSESNANLDWRSLLPPDTRQRIVNRFMDKLKSFLPEGSGNELQNIAVRSEEKIYNAATSQFDYQRKTSLKMLSMENKTQPGLNPSLPNQNPMDPGEGMTPQHPSLNPGQSFGMPQVMNQPPASRQQQPLLQGSHKMSTAVPGGPSGATITPMSGSSTSNSYPMSRPSGTSGPYWLPPYENVFKQETATAATSHATKAAAAGGSGMMSAAPTGGMQQSLLNSVQQKPMGQGGSFQQQPLVRQQPQPTMQNPTMPMQWTNNVTDLQQQWLQMQQNQLQQSQIQQNQLQSSQMQQKHVLYQQMMLGQQQNQLLGSGGAGNMNNMQQRHMQMQRQADLLQQQQRQHLLSQLQSQQQQLPQQQQPSMMQQREMQMPQQQMQGSPALLQMQNSNAIDPQRQQQQQFIPQQQPPQQQQRVLQDVASSPASMDSTAQTAHPGDWQDEMYQRLNYLKESYFADLREIHQNLSIKLSQMDSIVPPNARGGEQIEKMKHFKMVLERMMAVLQLGKHNMQIGLKDKFSLYEKQILSILQNHKKAPQQQPQAGAPSDQPHFPGLQQSQPSLQSQQLLQQRVLRDVASNPASMDSTAQTGNPGDWQEEMYQRLKYLKDTYFADLREIHQKLSMKLSQLDSIVPPNARGGEQIEKMKHFKMVLERMMAVLQLGKHSMQIGLKDKLSLYEKQILSILQNHKKAPQEHPQAGALSDQPHFPGLQQSQPSLQSQQLPQQQQPQQMDSQNQLQQQLNTSAMPQSNNIGMPNAMQQGIQNTLQSDQLRASSTGFGSLQQGAMGSSLQNTMKTRKCKICKDCVHKRRNSN